MCMARRAARRDCSGALCQQSRPSQSARGEAKDEQLRCPPSWRITASEASTYPSASYLNSIVANPHFLDGSLQVVLPEWKVPDMAIYALYPSRKHLSPAVRALLDFLVERFAKTPW